MIRAIRNYVRSFYSNHINLELIDILRIDEKIVNYKKNIIKL